MIGRPSRLTIPRVGTNWDKPEYGPSMALANPCACRGLQVSVFPLVIRKKKDNYDTSAPVRPSLVWDSGRSSKGHRIGALKTENI